MAGDTRHRWEVGRLALPGRIGQRPSAFLYVPHRRTTDRRGGYRRGCSGVAAFAAAPICRGCGRHPDQRAGRPPREITAVLDDYHLITSEPVHEAVYFLIEHIPQNVSLVILSRTDPPLPLPKLRARDQMIEIRAADLRFTKEETSTFLEGVMGLTLSAGDVATLEEITEGWVAALQLAALSTQGREDVSSFVEAFSGSNRHVLDFLTEEVLARQPDDVREFLLETSVLERMSAPLCNALTVRNDGQEMLERLERENLFVVPLDDERRWYRYPHLFAAFLRGRLERN